MTTTPITDRPTHRGAIGLPRTRTGTLRRGPAAGTGTTPRAAVRFTAVLTGAVLATGVLSGMAGASISRGAARADTRSVHSSVPAPPSTPTSLTETGSSLLYPLWNLWVAAYTTKYHTVSITTASTGSGTGISSALTGTADIGASDAYLPPTDFTKYKTARNIPLAISAQFIAYNLPGMSHTVRLNGPVLSEMYQGKITTWNAKPIADINPGVTLPATPVVTIHRSDSSGDTFLFTSYLTKTDPKTWGAQVGFGTTVAWPTVSGALAEDGNSGMLQGCQATPGCVAYIGISYLSKAKSAGLGEAELENARHKYVLPTASTISAASAAFAKRAPDNGVQSMINGPASGGYPIVNYEYAIVLTNQPSSTTAQAMRSVLSWAISPSGGNASAYLQQVDFQPLPSRMAAVSDKLINEIK